MKQPVMILLHLALHKDIVLCVLCIYLHVFGLKENLA